MQHLTLPERGRMGPSEGTMVLAAHRHTERTAEVAALAVLSICGFCCAPRYDRSRLSLKEISNVQFVSCMNPTAGSFTINPRLQVKPCSMAWGFGWIVQAQGSGDPGADPAVVQSVEAAWMCEVTVIRGGEAAHLLPSTLLCDSSCFAAQWEEEVTSSQTARHPLSGTLLVQTGRFYLPLGDIYCWTTLLESLLVVRHWNSDEKQSDQFWMCSEMSSVALHSMVWDLFKGWT